MSIEKYFSLLRMFSFIRNCSSFRYTTNIEGLGVVRPGVIAFINDNDFGVDGDSSPGIITRGVFQIGTQPVKFGIMKSLNFYLSWYSSNLLLLFQYIFCIFEIFDPQPLQITS